MRKLLFILLLISSGNLLFAQDSANVNKTATTDTANMAKVYLIRSTGHVGSAVNLRLVVDDVMLCKIKNNRHAIFYVQPGTHVFYATSWDKSTPREKNALKMTVEAGKEYYFSMRIKTRFMETEIFLEEITYNTASPQLQKYKRDECD